MTEEQALEIISKLDKISQIEEMLLTVIVFFLIIGVLKSFGRFISWMFGR